VHVAENFNLATTENGEEGEDDNDRGEDENDDDGDGDLQLIF